MIDNEFRRRNKSVVVLLVIFIVVLLASVGLVSYAVLSNVIGADREQAITAGDLDVTLTGNIGVLMNNMFPLSDTNGRSTATAYKVTITNNTNATVYYKLNVENVCAVNSSVGGITINKCIPLTYIKGAYSNNNSSYTNFYGVSGTTYVVKNTGTSLAANSSADVYLKLWLAQDTPNEYQGISTEGTGPASSGTARNVAFVGKVTMNVSQSNSF